MQRAAHAKRTCNTIYKKRIYLNQPPESYSVWTPPFPKQRSFFSSSSPEWVNSCHLAKVTVTQIGERERVPIFTRGWNSIRLPCDPAFLSSLFRLGFYVQPLLRKRRDAGVDAALVMRDFNRIRYTGWTNLARLKTARTYFASVVRKCTCATFRILCRTIDRLRLKFDFFLCWKLFAYYYCTVHLYIFIYE